jgi:hypothetical protein
MSMHSIYTQHSMLVCSSAVMRAAGWRRSVHCACHVRAVALDMQLAAASVPPVASSSCAAAAAKRNAAPACTGIRHLRCARVCADFRHVRATHTHGSQTACRCDRAAVVSDRIDAYNGTPGESSRALVQCVSCWPRCRLMLERRQRLHWCASCRRS